MSIQARIILGLICCIIAFAAGWRVKGWKDEAAQKATDDLLLQRIDTLQHMNAQLGAQLDSYVQQLNTARANAQAKLGESYAKNPSYRTCVVTADDRLQLIAAVNSTHAGK